MNDLEKVTLRIRAGDKDFINSIFPTVGHNKVIRSIISNYVNKQREALNKARGAAALPPIDIGDLND
jgi:hypothetical protein